MGSVRDGKSKACWKDEKFLNIKLGLRQLLFLDSPPEWQSRAGARNDVMLSEVEALKFVNIKLAIDGG